MDVENLLTAPASESDSTLAALRETLRRRAADEGLLDVAYRTLDSPVGPLLLAATPAGLVRVAFTTVEEPDAVLEALAGAVSPRVLEAPARLDAVARELDEYFAGQRHAFDLPVDLQLAHGFRRAALQRLVESRTDGPSPTPSSPPAPAARAPSAPWARRAP